LELRTRKLALTGESSPADESASFANAKMTNVSIGIAQTERYLTRMKLGFDTILVSDLYEKTDWPLLRTIPPVMRSYSLVSLNLYSQKVMFFREPVQIRLQI
jgi:hypothetical protein